MEQGLQTGTGLESVSVVCRALRPGSVKADMNIFIEPTNMTALETQDLFGLSLESLANESNGFLDSDTISVQNNGTKFFHIHIVLKVSVYIYPALCIRTWGIHRGMSGREREKPGVTTYFVSPFCYYLLQAFILHGPSKGRGVELC